MTNVQIITGACKLYGVTEDVDTYQGWRRRGKQVRKGSKALFKTRIWKPVKNKSLEAMERGEEEDGVKLILVDASFFGKSQVDELEKNSRSSNKALDK